MTSSNNNRPWARGWYERINNFQTGNEEDSVGAASIDTILEERWDELLRGEALQNYLSETSSTVYGVTAIGRVVSGRWQDELNAN
jgi:hypothetical protein